MRKDVLHNALLQPGMLTEEQLRELRETVDRYPFFGAAHVALSQAYRELGDHRFTDQLSSAAIYTSNRSSLYQRFKKERAIDFAVTSTIAPKVVESSGSLASAIVDREDETTAPPISIAAPLAIPSPEPAEQQPRKEEQPVMEQQQVHPEHATIVRVDLLETLDAQILVDAVSKSIELEVQPEIDPTEEQHLPEPEPLIPDDENSYAALIYRRSRQLQQNLGQTPETSSFSQESADEDLPAFQSTPLSHGIRRIQTTGAKEHQRDLIDRFIRTEPQIARGKAGEYQAGNLAKDSLEEDFSFVTETMAILFAKQGKTDKARKAFRKLMEQHPEKSIYFAAQLKNLEHFKK